MNSAVYLNRTLLLFTIFSGSSFVRADEPLPPQPQVSFTEGTANTWNADWSGVEDRTYFAQGSTDLVNWEFLPVLEFGTGLKGAGIDTEGAPKYFFRLSYVDYDWVGSFEFARLADFDGDGIPNLFEVDDLGTDPLDKESDGGDSNANGISDGYELYHFGALGVSGLGDDPDNDGLVNQIEALLGMNADADHEEGVSDKWEIHLPN
jgi:hypothetical protein